MPAATAPISRSTAKDRLDDFSHHWRQRIDQWRADGRGHTEKSAAQQFWSDLFRCFGIIPERIDLFERDAARASTGRTGYIDLFWSGVVLGEAKSLGRDLDAAFEQALDYLAGGSIEQHEWPKYVLVSDFENLHLTRLGDEGWTTRFTIDDITDHIDQLRFLAGVETVTKQEEADASLAASRLMANLFTAMAGDDVDEPVGDDAPTNPEDEDEKVQRTSMYLTRLLFLLFGDDAGLWEEDLFYRFVVNHTTAENLGARLNTLFQVLNTPEHQRRRVPAEFEKFPYVNGSIFADHMPQEFFDNQMRDALLAACRFHWSRISPAVFGSLFQLVKSRKARRADGEHYTSETNILKTLEPLFLDELRTEAQRLINAKSTPVKKLREFRDSLADMLFCDPACGAGNFLVVAYRELRKIETDVIVAIREREGQTGMALDVTWEQKLSIDQFHGFELNWWPAKIAETAMFLVDHQANRQLAEAIGAAPDRLPITITAHIHHGNALHMDWTEELPSAKGYTYIFGNPPFAGHKERSKSQTQDMKAVWGKGYHGYLDFVTSWFKKAQDFYGSGRPGEFAFVSTNSITQGEQVAPLYSPLSREGWWIKFAHRTFLWKSEAPGQAKVHCVIVGFSRSRDHRPQLWDYETVQSEPHRVPVTKQINGYLLDAPVIAVSAKKDGPISSQLPIVNSGSNVIDWGFLTIKDRKKLEEIQKDPIAAKYIRSFIGGHELINGIERWILYLADLDPADIDRSPQLQERLAQVKTKRAASPDGPTRKAAEWPHRFLADRQPTVPYLGIPQTFSEKRKYFTGAWLDADVIASMKLYTCNDEDGFAFSIISSAAFMAWQRTVGGRMKSDPSFSIVLAWNTFPLPALDRETRERIIQGGQAVLKARALYPGRSLAQQYHHAMMDPALVKAHDKLDREVDKAFGAPRKLTTEERRLEYLFASYSKMTSGSDV